MVKSENPFLVQMKRLRELGRMRRGIRGKYEAETILPANSLSQRAKTNLKSKITRADFINFLETVKVAIRNRIPPGTPVKDLKLDPDLKRNWQDILKLSKDWVAKFKLMEKKAIAEGNMGIDEIEYFSDKFDELLDIRSTLSETKRSLPLTRTRRGRASRGDDGDDGDSDEYDLTKVRRQMVTATHLSAPYASALQIKKKPKRKSKSDEDEEDEADDADDEADDEYEGAPPARSDDFEQTRRELGVIAAQAKKLGMSEASEDAEELLDKIDEYERLVLSDPANQSTRKENSLNSAFIRLRDNFNAMKKQLPSNAQQLKMIKDVVNKLSADWNKTYTNNRKLMDEVRNARRNRVVQQTRQMEEFVNNPPLIARKISNLRNKVSGLKASDMTPENVAELRHEANDIVERIKEWEVKGLNLRGDIGNNDNDDSNDDYDSNDNDDSNDGNDDDDDDASGSNPSTPRRTGKGARRIMVSFKEEPKQRKTMNSNYQVIKF